MKNLTGKWQATGARQADKGTYYFRQVTIGSDQVLCWHGQEDPTIDSQWSNVAYGTISGNNIIGMNWVDLPVCMGKENKGAGTLTLKIIDENTVKLFAADGGYFGGREWKRCR